jgi:hypothetical protein
MRWLGLSSFVLLSACGASEFQSQRLADGSYTFKCELAMDACIRRAQEQCQHQRFRILEGTSETRLRDAPPFERAYHTSRLHLMCTDDGATVELMADSENSSKPRPAAGCEAGETRACVGPGGCKGGQACLPDGSRFGSCDCGSPTPPAAPEPASTSSPPPATPASSAEPASSGPGTAAAPPTPAP